MSQLSAQLQQLTNLVAKIAVSAESPEVEGLDPRSTARYLGIGITKLHEMNANGDLPAPVQFGDRCPRWSRTELCAWMLAGAPSRVRWNAMREVKLRQAG